MARRNERITIQQPPLQELTKKRSCIKRTCFTGCLFIFLFLGGMFLLVQFISAPGEKRIETLPQKVHDSIIIYDEDNIDSIVYTQGREQHKLIETIAIIPKVILSPIILNLEDRVQPNHSTWKTVVDFVHEPITDTRDMYVIEWTNLPATPQFIRNYYESNLKKQGFTLSIENQLLYFSKDAISGTLYVDTTSQTQAGTAVIRLQVFLPT